MARDWLSVAPAFAGEQERGAQSFVALTICLFPARKAGGVYRRVALLLCVLLAACVGPTQRGGRPSRPAVSGPALSHEPSKRETRLCEAKLDDAGIKYSPLPDRHGPGDCSTVGTIRLSDFGIPTSGLGPLRCGIAQRFVDWVRGPVQEAAAAWLQSPVVAVETMGSYSCRPINSQSGNRLSEHGVADAIDVSAFRLADGRRITVLDGWNGADENARNFLRAVHQSACDRFGVVLGPDANALHHNHLHLDMAPERYCR